MGNPPANAGDLETWVQFLGWEDPLEECMATPSSTRAWRIPWTRSLVGCSPLGRRDLSHKSTQHNTVSPSHLHFFLNCLLRELSYFMELNFFFFNFTLASIVDNFQTGYVFHAFSVTFAGSQTTFLVMQPHLLATSRNSLRVH